MKEMQNTGRYTKLIVIALLIGMLTIAPALSSLTDTAVIGNTGTISYFVEVTAASGYWQDIQAAVNQVVASGGKGNVSIPEGTFNFVNVGESWTGARVNIPAGVNLFGAPTERDADGQVVEWRTILVMPWNVPGAWTNTPVWFSINGNSDLGKPSRFSDIKLQGYRSISSSSTTIHRAIAVDRVRDFRIDHCAFEHTTGGILAGGLYCNGVIDHNKLYNIYGFDDLSNYMNGNIGYGIQVARDLSSIGYEPLMNVLGKYTDHSVFIEDNYFSKWRHCVASGHGAHYVFRYNVIDDDFGHFSLDAHGLRDTGSNRWGTRATEFYENTLTNVMISEGWWNIFQNGGGSGVWFNNYIDTSYRSNGIVLYTEDVIQSETWHLKDFYLWSSKGPWAPSGNGVPSGFTADRNVLADWSRQAGDPTDLNYPNVNPSWSIAGYKPYPYPHPLTL